MAHDQHACCKGAPPLCSPLATPAAAKPVSVQSATQQDCQRPVCARAPPHAWCRRTCLSQQHANCGASNRLCTAASKPTGEHRQCASATLPLNASGALIAPLHSALPQLFFRGRLSSFLAAAVRLGLLVQQDTDSLADRRSAGRRGRSKGLRSPGQVDRCDTVHCTLSDGPALDLLSCSSAKDSLQEQRSDGVSYRAPYWCGNSEDVQARRACAAAVQRGDLLGQRRRSGAYVPGT